MTELDDMLKTLRLNNPGVFDSSTPIFDLVTVSLVDSGPHRIRQMTQADALLPNDNGRNYFGVYLTSDEYLIGVAAGMTPAGIRRAVIHDVLSKVDQESLLVMLRNLDAALGIPERQSEIRIRLEERLVNPARDSLRVLLDQDNRALYSSQGVLAAFRTVIIDGSPREVNVMDPAFGAILLVQSVLEGNEVVSPSGRTLGEFPEELAMSIVANHEFNSANNIFADFDRTLRVFEDKDGKFTRILGGKSPRELVRLATGLRLEDLQTCAMILLANDLEKDLWATRGLNKRVNDSIDEAIVRKFWQLCSRTVGEFIPLLSSQQSEWDYFAFEKFPLLEFPDAVLLVSRGLIMERVTGGLYHFVFEYLEQNDPKLKSKWMSVWGDMVENAIVSSLKPLAPTALGDGSFYFTEAEIGLAYPQGKKCDAVIDYGHTALAVEIVSSPLSRGSRQALDVDAFLKDMERIVFKKLRQLSATSINLAKSPMLLLGPNRSAVRIRPLLVTGGGFPVNPITVNLINEKIVDEGLFAHHLIETVCIVSAEELEYLEALKENGFATLDLLSEWRDSGPVIGNYTMKNWIKSDDRFKEKLRPERMNPLVRTLFATMRSVFAGDQL